MLGFSGTYEVSRASARSIGLEDFRYKHGKHPLMINMYFSFVIERQYVIFTAKGSKIYSGYCHLRHPRNAIIILLVFEATHMNIKL